MTLFPVAPYRAAGSFFADDPAGEGDVVRGEVL